MPLPIVFDNFPLSSLQWGLVHPEAGDTFEVTEHFNSAIANGTIHADGSGIVTLTFSGAPPLDLIASVFDDSDVIIMNSADGTSGPFYISHTEHNAGDIFSFTERDPGDFNPCFAAGTRIATPNGDRLVEDLRTGDVVLTHDLRQRAVRWVGHRRVDLARHRRPEEVVPVIIRANALADRVPLRDLVVSPEHAILVEGGLVPARLLVNGASIVRDMTRRDVVYYHVELESHDVLLAEGAPAESYLDTGNRWTFENADKALVHSPAETGQLDRIARSCAPFCDDALVVEPIWRRLTDRASRLGYALPPAVQTTDDPQMMLVAGAQRFVPVSCHNDVYTFVVPAHSGHLRLVSRATTPCTLKPWLTDRRRLGVAVRHIVLRQQDCVQTIPADDPALNHGWWQAESDGSSTWRWTSGDAWLPVSLSWIQPMTVTIDTCAPTTYPIAQYTNPADRGTALAAVR